MLIKHISAVLRIHYNFEIFVNPAPAQHKGYSQLLLLKATINLTKGILIKTVMTS